MAILWASSPLLYLAVLALILQEPTPQKVAPAPPLFGDYADLANLVRNGQDSATERFPGTLIRDFGIETKAEYVDSSRVVLSDKVGGGHRIAILVSVSESKTLYLVIVQMEKTDTGFRSTYMLVESTGILVSAHQRPKNGAPVSTLTDENA